MALTAGELIRDARQLHPAFDPTRNWRALLLRELTRLSERLLRRIARTHPDVVAVETAQITLPLPDYAAGHVLPAFLRLLRARTWTAEIDVPLTIVPTSQRHAPAVWPALIERGGTVYQTGAETFWQGYTAFAVEYVPAPVAITDEATTMQLPDDSRETFVSGLGAFMAGRTRDADLEGAPPIDRQHFRDEAVIEMREFLLGLGARKVVIAQIPEVW